MTGMHAKIGATIMAGLLYGQSALGLVALACVVTKEPAVVAPHASGVSQSSPALASAGSVAAL
jgi:hypothetical protein